MCFFFYQSPLIWWVFFFIFIIPLNSMKRKHFLKRHWKEAEVFTFVLVSLWIWWWLHLLRFHKIVFNCGKFKMSRFIFTQYNKTRKKRIGNIKCLLHILHELRTVCKKQAKILWKSSFSLYSITLIVYYPFSTFNRDMPSTFRSPFHSQNMTFFVFTYIAHIAIEILWITVLIQKPSKIWIHIYIDTFVSFKSWQLLVSFLHIMIINSISQTFPVCFFFHVTLFFVLVFMYFCFSGFFVYLVVVERRRQWFPTRFMVELFILVYS